MQIKTDWSDTVWVDTYDDLWRLCLALPRISDEGLVEEFDNPDEVESLAEELKKQAQMLREKKATWQPVCAMCKEYPDFSLGSSLGYRTWYGHIWCKKCADYIERIRQKRGTFNLDYFLAGNYDPQEFA